MDERLIIVWLKKLNANQNMEKLIQHNSNVFTLKKDDFIVRSIDSVTFLITKTQL